MQNRHAAFEYKAPNCSNNWYPYPTYFHAQRSTGWKFCRVFLQVRKDRNAGKYGSSGLGVTNLLRGRPLSNQIWLEVPRRLALPYVFPVHIAEKLICSTASQRICTLQVFHAFLESPRKCSGTSKKKSMSQDSISQNWLMGHLHQNHSDCWLNGNLLSGVSGVWKLKIKCAPVTAHVKLENLWQSRKTWASEIDWPELRSQCLYH